MYWANFFHIYQPPNWPKKIIKKVANESYRPLLNILKRNKKLKITLNISGSLTGQLAEYKLNDIIDDIKKLAANKQIEFTGTAIYHPILPLISTKEIIRQIKLNAIINKKYFGEVYQPVGFFPPEMSYGRKIVTAIQSLGYRWILADEISHSGALGKADFGTKYQIINTKINIIFRNRIISDFFTFHSNPNYPENFWKAVKSDNRSKPAIITAMDGENLGHHRKGWDAFWKKLATSKGIKTLTISELLNKYKHTKVISPRRASWSSQEREIKQGNPYILWDDPHNPIHQLQWRLLRHVTMLVEQSQKLKNYKKARELLDRRLASDQFWWASAKPWWSQSIIKKKTRELRQIALLLDKNDKLADQLTKKIVSLATTWQEENEFKTIADQYLASNEDEGVRFIGGKKISTKAN